MKRSFLTSLGLETEQVDQIMVEHGKAVNAMKDDIEKVDQLKQQIKDKDEEIKTRNKQLEDLKGSAAGNEDLQAEIDKLKQANTETEKAYQDKLNKQAHEFAVEKALRDAKVRNPKAVKGLLDLEAIKLDGEKLLGFDDQITALKESDDYLFEQEQTPPGLQGRSPSGATKPPKVGGDNPFKKESINLTEQGRLLREDPQSAKTLISQAGLSPAKYGL